MFQKFGINTVGKDFVIGDLHGRFDLFCQFFDKHLDTSVDRVFSVGDLIDRGSDSFSCLKLLENPWFHAVKGNHEQLMEDWMTGGPTGPWWFTNGGGWFFNLSEEQQNEVVDFLPIVQSLPWVISVGDDFHIIHAELPKLTHPLEESDLLSHSGDGPVGIWGRQMWGQMYRAALDPRTVAKNKRRIKLEKFSAAPFLGVVFSGHTTLQKPAKIFNFINIDTGAFRSHGKEWAGLTVVEPNTRKIWLVRDDGITENNLVEII